MLDLGTSVVHTVVGAVGHAAGTAPIAIVTLQTIGVVLMVAGAAGLVLSFIMWSSWGRGRRRTAVARDRDAGVRDVTMRNDGHDDMDQAA